MAEISKSTGYSVLSAPPGSISKTVGYAVLSTETNVAVSKTVGYAVIEEVQVEPAYVSKLNYYAVIAPPGLPVSKLNYYAVLSTEVTLSVSKLNYYAVLEESTDIINLEETVKFDESISSIITISLIEIVNFDDAAEFYHYRDDLIETVQFEDVPAFSVFYEYLVDTVYFDDIAECSDDFFEYPQETVKFTDTLIAWYTSGKTYEDETVKFTDTLIAYNHQNSFDDDTVKFTDKIENRIIERKKILFTWRPRTNLKSSSELGTYERNHGFGASGYSMNPYGQSDDTHLSRYLVCIWFHIPHHRVIMDYCDPQQIRCLTAIGLLDHKYIWINDSTQAEQEASFLIEPNDDKNSWQNWSVFSGIYNWTEIVIEIFQIDDVKTAGQSPTILSDEVGDLNSGRWSLQSILSTENKNFPNNPYKVRHKIGTYSIFILHPVFFGYASSEAVETYIAHNQINRLSSLSQSLLVADVRSIYGINATDSKVNNIPDIGYSLINTIKFDTTLEGYSLLHTYKDEYGNLVTHINEFGEVENTIPDWDWTFGMDRNEDIRIGPQGATKGYIQRSECLELSIDSNTYRHAITCEGKIAIRGNFYIEMDWYIPESVSMAQIESGTWALRLSLWPTNMYPLESDKIRASAIRWYSASQISSLSNVHRMGGISDTSFIHNGLLSDGSDAFYAVRLLRSLGWQTTLYPPNTLIDSEYFTHWTESIGIKCPCAYDNISASYGQKCSSYCGGETVTDSGFRWGTMRIDRLINPRSPAIKTPTSQYPDLNYGTSGFLMRHYNSEYDYFPPIGSSIHNHPYKSDLCFSVCLESYNPYGGNWHNFRNYPGAIDEVGNSMTVHIEQIRIYRTTTTANRGQIINTRVP